MHISLIESQWNVKGLITQFNECLFFFFAYLDQLFPDQEHSQTQPCHYSWTVLQMQK